MKYSLLQNQNKKIFALLNKLIQTLNALLSVFLIIRILPDHEFALLTLFITFDMMIFSISGGLVLQALQKYTAETEEGQTDDLISNAVWLYGLLVILPSLCIVILRSGIESILNAEGLALLLMLLPLFIISQWGRKIAYFVLLAREKVRDVFIVDGLAFITKAGLVIAAVWVGMLDKALSVIIIFIISHTIGSLAGVFLLRGHVRLRFKFSPIWTRKILAFGKYTLGTTIGNMIHTRTDTLMISFFYGTSAVALYSAARRIADFFRHFIQAANMIVLPRASLLSAKQDFDGVRSIYNKGLIYSAALIVPVVLPLIIIPGIVILFAYQGRYSESLPILQIFALCTLISPFGTIGSSVASGIGRPQDTCAAIWFSVIVNIALNIVWIPKFGVIGAAYATLVAMIAGGTFITYFVHRQVGLSLSEKRGSIHHTLKDLIRRR